MKLSVKKMTILAILAGLAAIAKNFSIYLTPESKIVIHNIPIMIVSIIFNPIYGVLVAVIADIASIPTTPGWNPIFSLPILIWGIIPGLFFLKNKKIKLYKLMIVEYITYFFVSLGNFFVFWGLYGLETSVGRLPLVIPVYFIKAPIDIFILYILFENFLTKKMQEINY